MLRPLECFIGFRYLRTGRGRGLISFMSFASLIGLTLGVAALIVILSAMNGLEAESRNRLLSLADHITMHRMAERDVDLAALRETFLDVDGVVEVTPFIRIEALLSSGRNLRPVIVRGIDPAAEGADSDLARVIGPGNLARLTPGSHGILLGRFVALNLGVRAGDRITVLLPGVHAGRLDLRRESFTVLDDFAAGVEAHDANLALVSLADAEMLGSPGGDAPGLSIRLANPMDVARVEQVLRARAGEGVTWSNWATENRSLFQAMSIEKTMMTIVMMFIVGVAAFNVVTSLTMVVNEKSKDIAILRTMGFAATRVMRVFLVQGAAIGIGGTLLGVVIGLLLAFNLETILPWLEQTFGFQIMPGDVFYVTEVPSEVRLQDVLLIPGFALLISLLATIMPSRRAARIEPAEVLRYE